MMGKVAENGVLCSIAKTLMKYISRVSAYGMLTVARYIIRARLIRIIKEWGVPFGKRTTGILREIIIP